VRLFVGGKWKTHLLDVQFPINKQGKYCGVRTQSSNIWPMLLEKAAAKEYGSYDEFEK
jgi:hypothetical protein